MIREPRRRGGGTSGNGSASRPVSISSSASDQAGRRDRDQRVVGELRDGEPRVVPGTLEQVPFLFGAAPTLADAALYGNLVMLREADAALPARLWSALEAYMARLEAASRLQLER